MSDAPDTRSDDEKMVMFLKLFAASMDAESAAELASVDKDWAEAKFLRNVTYRERLNRIFEQRTKLYEYVPLAVIRLEMLNILMDPKISASNRVAAGKILADMVVGVGGDSQKKLGEILAAVENAVGTN